MLGVECFGNWKTSSIQHSTPNLKNSQRRLHIFSKWGSLNWFDRADLFAGLGFLRPRHFLQRRFRRTREYFPLGFEPRAVTRTIPGLVRRIPAHNAFHVSANGRAKRDLSRLIAI